MATTKKSATAAAPKAAKPVKATPARPALAAVAEATPVLAPKKAPASRKTPAKAAPKMAAVPAASDQSLLQREPAVRAEPVVGTVWHEVDPEKRASYIEVAAYYIAERRGFAPGNPEQDYLEAAAEIDRLIAAGHFSR